MLRSCVHLAWKKMDEYYQATDVSKVYLVASVLDPRLKMEYFKKHWKKSWLKDYLKKLDDLMEEFTTTMGQSSANDDTWEADSEVEVMEDDVMEDTQTTSGSFGVWYDEMPSTNIEEDEWTRYLKLPLVRNWNGF